MQIYVSSRIFNGNDTLYSFVCLTFSLCKLSDAYLELQNMFSVIGTNVSIYIKHVFLF